MLKIPFVTTWSTVDMFTSSFSNLIGSFGVSSNRPGNFAVQSCDLLISLGSRLDTHMTGANASKFSLQKPLRLWLILINLRSIRKMV